MAITALFIDSREPTWVKELKFGGLPVTVTFLEQGDIMAATDDGTMILVERKTPGDFLNSLRDDRVMLQLANMLTVTRWSYLMITGEFQRGSNGKVIIDRGETGWSWNAVDGSLLTAQEMGIFVSHCANDQDYEAAILRLGNRDHKNKLELGPAKQPRILSINETIIASLPGIGIERLHLVMNECQTAAWALCCLTDSSSKIKGVPDSVKKRVRQALGLKAETQLGVEIENGEEVIKIIELGSQ